MLSLRLTTQLPRRAPQSLSLRSLDGEAMRPGQLDPNDFERAVLGCFGRQDPSLLAHIDALHVLSREFTGVGSFTRFQFEGSGSSGDEQQLGLDAEIHMPSVPSGLGAVLFCSDHHPTCLEVFTYGDEAWDGVHDGFSIHATI